MRILIMSFFALLVSFGCGKKEVPPEERTLNLIFPSEVRTLDPRLGGESPMPNLMRMLFEGLMRRDENGVTAPAVAKSYTVSSDYKTYTFTLRETCWSDGEPVTAHDFEYAWRKSLDPKTLSHGAQNFYFIKNAKLSAEGKVPPEAVGIRALDPYTFEVQLEYPTPYFIDVLGCTLFYPVPKHLNDCENSSWAQQTDSKFVSNGPFRLKQWKRGDSISVEKNPLYWERDKVRLPEIKMDFVTNGMTQFYMYEKKEVDWIGSPLSYVHPEALLSLKKDPSYMSLPGTMVHWFFINTSVFPFTNKKIRQALSYVINRQELVDHIFEEEATPAMGIVSPTFGFNNAPCFKDANVQEAKKLFDEGLEELGLTRETFPTLVIKNSPSRDTASRIALEVQQVWSDAFGVKVSIHQADWPVQFTAIQRGDYQLGMMTWVSFLTDPIYMLQTFKYKEDMVNMSNWESEEYFKLLEASNHESDPEKRRKMLVTAEKLLMDAMPVIPIAYVGMDFAKTPDLVGVTLSPIGEIDFKFASFSQ